MEISVHFTYKNGGTMTNFPQKWKIGGRSTRYNCCLEFIKSFNYWYVYIYLYEINKYIPVMKTEKMLGYIRWNFKPNLSLFFIRKMYSDQMHPSIHLLW